MLKTLNKIILNKKRTPVFLELFVNSISFNIIHFSLLIISFDNVLVQHQQLLK